MVKVLGFGDNVIDRFLDRGLDYPGGNCVNFAVFARQLGVEAAYLGVFGSDEQGDFIREVLVSLDIDVSRSIVREGESGLAQVEVIDGERIFRGGNGGGVTAAEPINLGQAELQYVSQFALVHSSVYSTSESELPKLAQLRTLVSYDLSSEDDFRTAEYLDRVAPYVDLMLASCSHLSEADTHAVLAEIVDHGSSMALGSRGNEGSVLFDGTAYYQVQATPIVDVANLKDTMGCGDALLSAFVIELLRVGWVKGSLPTADSLTRALAIASPFASLQCATEGAFGNGRLQAPETNFGRHPDSGLVSRFQALHRRVPEPLSDPQ